MTGDDVDEELRRRAALLAQPPAPAPAADTLALLRFSWGGASFLVPTTHVRETIRSVRVFAVPGATPPLLGAATVRSQALPVLDLRAVVGAPTPQREVARLVVLEDVRRPSLALAADALERVVRVRPAELHDPAGPSAAVRAVTSSGESLLDADALLDLPPFFRTTEGPRP